MHQKSWVRKSVCKLMVFLIVGIVAVRAMPVFAQDASTLTTYEKALRNALIEICYGTRVLVDLNDPAKTEVSLAETGLNDETIAALIADAAETDGSYVALSDLLISYCLGEETVTRIKPVSNDPTEIEVILIEIGIVSIEDFFILVDQYVYFEEYIITYFESYSFTEEQYAAIFFTLEFGTSTELTELLVEYGVEESAVEEFVDYAEETIDQIESEEPTDADEDGVLDIEDTDDDDDGVEDEEDTDDDGDGVEDEEEDDDADNDGIDDEEDDDVDGDGVDDEEDTDDDGDGVDDDDADGDGVEDEEDTDDDGDGTDDEEDTDDDGDGSEDEGDDSMIDDDGGVDDGGDEGE